MLVDKQGKRPNPDLVKSVLTSKVPTAECQVQVFSCLRSFAENFSKGMLTKWHKGKIFTRDIKADAACEARVLGMPTSKCLYVLDTDTSVDGV